MKSDKFGSLFENNSLKANNRFIGSISSTTIDNAASSAVVAMPALSVPVHAQVRVSAIVIVRAHALVHVNDNVYNMYCT